MDHPGDVAAERPVVTRPIRILLADDQELLRDALATVLGAEQDIDVVATAGDGAAVVSEVRAHEVDVVLMDIRMPGMDGIRATVEVVRARPRTRVLVLTTFDIDEYVFAAIRAGASGFLTKDARPAALTAAIRSVAAGDAVVSPRAAPSCFSSGALLFLRREAEKTLPSRRAFAMSRLTEKQTGYRNGQAHRKFCGNHQPV